MRWHCSRYWEWGGEQDRQDSLAGGAHILVVGVKEAAVNTQITQCQGVISAKRKSQQGKDLTEETPFETVVRKGPSEGDV